MAKLHVDELEITTNLVLQLLKKQCPQWANLSLQPISSSGTDNALFRLGDDLVVRLPKIDWATQNIHKEYEWVPELASYLKTAVSVPIFEGKPDAYYPWPWMIVRWNDGINPSFEKGDEYASLAKDLANFLNELHRIPLKNGPLSRRGASLKIVDEETRKAIAALKDEFDISYITHLWEYFCTLLDWQQPAVWVHGDFLPGNILVKNNRLNAVIDFSDVGVGDPACDFIIAWSLFNKTSRQLFRENLHNVDEATWQRGKGCALSIALIILPYYKNTNPVLAAVAKNIIQQVLSDE